MSAVDEIRPAPAARRISLFWIAIWTAFLIEPLEAGWRLRDEPAGWLGIAATLAFGVWYVACFAWLRHRAWALNTVGPRRTALVLGVAFVLSLVVCLLLGQHGTATSVYICVLVVVLLPRPRSLAAAGVVAAGYYLSGFIVPGWERSNGLLLSMLTASIAVYGIMGMVASGLELRRATAENQRLAVANERSRFARDLHDILGHSLTVITVKAELAGRLIDTDPARAKAEVADLERLSRDALADVRQTVSGYRDVTLSGELARARGALATAEIEAVIPSATDDVPTRLRELFAWTVREGVTNVIRHSGASRCEILLSADRAEVRDDGRGAGADSGAGAGLVGLRERAEAVGATVVTRSLEPGFSLSVVSR